MTCAAITPDLALYLYGELSAEQEERLEQHCSECPGCTAELQRYHRMLQACDAALLPEPAHLLAECRQQLARTLAVSAAPPQAAARPNWFTREMRSLLSHSVAFRVPVGALALVAIGFFGARLAPEFGGSAVQAGLLNVRSVQADAAGRVQIAVDQTHRQTVSGSVDDPAVRKLLIDALHDESNAGVRVESVDMLKDHAALGDVRTALLDRLRNDPNPGVRLKAIAGLKAFGADAQVRQTLTGVLVNDANPGVRMQAIDLLTARRDPSLVGMLQGVMRKEENPYVRLKVRGALQDMHASVGTF